MKDTTVKILTDERDSALADLAECAQVRDSWCSEYTKVRDELVAARTFFDRIPKYAGIAKSNYMTTLEDLDQLRRKAYKFEVRIRALESMEHRVRCDLIDALFYVELVSGTHGPGITDPERKRADEFHNRIAERYPMQKGKRSGMEQLANSQADGGTEHD